MGAVSQPHMRAASAVPQTRPSSAPTDHERAEGERLLEQAAVAPRRPARRAPGSDEQEKLDPEPEGELAPPDPAEHEPDRRGQPYVAEAHAGRADEPQHPEERPRERPSRRVRARAASRSPVASPTADHQRRSQRGSRVRRPRGAAAGCASRSPPARPRPGSAGPATAAASRGRSLRRAAPPTRPQTSALRHAEPGPGGDVGVEHLRRLVGGWRVLHRFLRRGLGHARDQPRAPAGRRARRAARRPSERAARTVSFTGSFNRHSAPQGAFAGIPHHVERRRPSGEELELQGRLVHQQVEAADEHPADAGRRRRAASATGRRAPRRRRARPHSRATRSGVWASAGMVDTTTSTRRSRRRPRQRATPTRPRARPGAPAAPRRSRPPGPRRAPPGRSRCTPRSASASPIEVAVAPPPRIAAVASGGRRALADRGDRAGEVGVVPEPGAVVLEHQRVDRAGQARAVGELVDQRQRLALERHRQRQTAPLRVQARPGTPPRPPEATRWAS